MYLALENWRTCGLVSSLTAYWLSMFQTFCSFPVFLLQMHTISLPNNYDPMNYGFRAYGELWRFVYCFLQKIKDSESLPVIEKWETNMLPNHSQFAAISLENCF